MRAQGLTLHPGIFRPVGVHRPGAPQHRHLAAARRGARGGRAVDLSRRRGRRGHLAHGDPAVPARRAHRARSASASASTRSRWADSPSRSARWWTTRSSTSRTSRGGCGRIAPSRGAAERGGVVLAASLEVRSSVVYATFVVALVFVPVLTLTGVQGALFRPLGTRVHPGDPRLAARGAHRDAGADAGVPRRPRSPGARSVPLAWLKARYAPRAPLARATGPDGGAARRWSASRRWRRCRSSAPPSCRSFARVTIWSTCRPCRARRSTSPFGWRAGDRGAQSATRESASVAQRIGRAELSEDTWGTHYTEFEVDLVPLTGRAAETVQDDLRAHPRELPGRQLRHPGVPRRADRGDAHRLDRRAGGARVRRRSRQPRRRGPAGGRGARAVARRHRCAIRPAAGGARGHRAPAAGRPPAATASAPTRCSPTIETATRGARVAQTFEGNRATDVVVILMPETAPGPRTCWRCRSRRRAGARSSSGASPTSRALPAVSDRP